MHNDRKDSSIFHEESAGTQVLAPVWACGRDRRHHPWGKSLSGGNLCTWRHFLGHECSGKKSRLGNVLKTVFSQYRSTRGYSPRKSIRSRCGLRDQRKGTGYREALARLIRLLRPGSFPMTRQPSTKRERCLGLERIHKPNVAKERTYLLAFTTPAR